jgi:hypothetical protein
MTPEDFPQMLEILDDIMIVLEALDPAMDSSGDKDSVTTSVSPLPSNISESVEQIVSPPTPSPKRKRGGKQGKRYR